MTANDKTPRTDAAIQKLVPFFECRETIELEAFARQLETELAEARAEVSKLKSDVVNVGCLYGNKWEKAQAEVEQLKSRSTNQWEELKEVKESLIAWKKECSSLRITNEQLRKDRDRLDWLEDNDAYVKQEFLGNWKKTVWRVYTSKRPKGWIGDNLRQAIDEAMEDQS